jgi:Amidase
MTSAAFCPAHVLAAEIAARRLSPVDLVEECLARIERLESRLHAFVSINAANARLAAEAAEKAIRAGEAVSPLYGIPIAVKGPGGDRGRGRKGRLGGLAQPHRTTHRHSDAQAGYRRHNQSGQDPHGGVRLWRLGHQPAPGGKLFWENPVRFYARCGLDHSLLA